MRRYLSLVVLIAFLHAQKGEIQPAPTPTPASQKEEPTEVPSKARIQILEREFDFGFAPQEGFLVHHYKVKNVGEDTLVITNVRPTCGCTAAPLTKNRLAPGEETYITAIFNTRGFTRKVTKSINVTSNDPTNKTLALTFSTDLDTAWFGNSPIIAEPKVIDFGKCEQLKDEIKIKIKNRHEKILTLKVIDYTDGIILKPALDNNPLKPKRETQCTVKLDPDCIKTEPLKASLTIAGYDKEEKEVVRLTIPVIGGGK